MNSRHKKLVYINSRNKISGTHSDFIYSINLQDIPDADHVVVLQCNIPKSWYMVQENFNTFTMEEDGVTATVTIPIGNYNRVNFKTTLQTLLNTSSPSNWTYGVSIPSASVGDNGKYTFTVSGNSNVQPLFTFDQQNNVYELMGFEVGTIGFNSNTLESPNVVKLQKEDTVFIHSDLCGQLTGSILQEVYANSADYDNIVFVNNNSELYSKRLRGNNSTSYRFWLTNEDGHLMDLNNQNYTMTLAFYKRELNYQDAVQAQVRIRNATG